MDTPLSLPALVSHAYVAFTIEFDNEFEHRTPHRTTTRGADGVEHARPWLVSMAVWLEILRHIPAEGVHARELLRITGRGKQALRQRLIRLSKWWNYLTVDRDYMIRPTPGGAQAIEILKPLAGMIERRWQWRFGEEEMAELRCALVAIGERLDPDLPDFLPIVSFGLFTRAPRPRFQAEGPPPVSALLAKPLLAFALEYEAESDVSLAIAANVLRVVGDLPAPMRELPKLTGVSKEATAMAFKYLKCRGYATVESHERRRFGALTEQGRAIRAPRLKRIKEVEQKWRRRFGGDVIDRLRGALEVLVQDGSAAAPIFECLKPYPEGWRAELPAPAALPHFPTILHRGGYPDGS